MGIVVKALSLVAIIAIGYLIKRIGWVKTTDFGIFATIVLRITLPCALATSFNDYHLPPVLLSLALACIGLNTAMQFTGWWMERHSSPSGRAFAVLNIPTFNMGAFATPYLAGFMGPAAAVHASLFDVGNALSAAGTGYAWATSIGDEHNRFSIIRFVRTMFSSVIFDVYLVLVLMQLLHLHFPHPVIVFTSTVGAANTFLAMLMIGIGLEIRLEKSQYRSAARYLGVRYTIATAFALLCWHLPLPHDIRLLLAMVAYAPIAAMTPGFTHETGGDVTLSTFMTSVSILVGIIAMPAIALALG